VVGWNSNCTSTDMPSHWEREPGRTRSRSERQRGPTDSASNRITKKMTSSSRPPVSHGSQANLNLRPPNKRPKLEVQTQTQALPRGFSLSANAGPQPPSPLLLPATAPTAPDSASRFPAQAGARCHCPKARMEEDAMSRPSAWREAW